MEILETGALRRIGYERTEDVEVTRLFQGVYGAGMLSPHFQLFCYWITCVYAGQSTAFKWYSAGCRTLDDLTAGRGGVKLTPAQEIGIRFYGGQTEIYTIEGYICAHSDMTFLQISMNVCPGRRLKPYLTWSNRLVMLRHDHDTSLLKCIPALKIDPKLFIEIMGSYRR